MVEKKIHVVFPRIETFHFHKAYDGGSKYIHYLAEELVKKGHHVTIVTTLLKKGDKSNIKFHNGVRYVFLPPFYGSPRKIKINIPYKILFSRNLKNYLEKIDFDILHSAEAFALPYLKKKKRRPVIYQTWAMEAWCGREVLSQRGIKKLYIELFLRKPWQKVLDKSDSIAADGPFQLQRILTLGAPKEKIFFLPNGVNFKQIQEMRKKSKNRRKELGIKKRNFLVLAVSQIAPDKGIEDIIQGFSNFKKETPSARLLIIGRGILEPKMKELFKKNDLIEEIDVFHRKNISEKDLYDYYFTSDVFISATLSEDFMITIQEAMACGLPIISSSQPYLVKENKNGYVVGFKNPEGIKEALLKIYNKTDIDRIRMGEESKKMADIYDYGNVANSALIEYKKLIKGS